MSIEIQGVPLNRVISFPFRNASSVQRLLILCAVGLAGFLVPILPGLFVSGYMMGILREAVRDGRVEMPAWKEPERLLKDGFFATLIQLVYMAPGLLVLMGGFLLYFTAILFSIPLADSRDGAMPGIFLLGIIFFFVSLALGPCLMMAGAVPLPIALARYADEGRFQAAFHLRQIARALKANPLGYLGAWLVCLGILSLCYAAYYILYLSIVFCCLSFLPLIAGFAAGGPIFLAMIGLAYRQGKEVLPSS
jgi:hypothetical protein